ncbi:exodeoxyribonuclease VII large subunit [uncultured Gemmiger sp.]|uniref:exodeoxyribonuclease VII large subunit n=1 Tax=uncultured Gemmiger sp. TaxID=1623490 RepID=UPI0025D9609C|nr:exodeoxyribonuclease VII large subunit [uncultured Gemmiger sp.]
MADFIKVTDLNRLAKQVLAQCDPLNDVIVCGEISGFVRHYKSGHIYFTLKDENAGVKAVMFRSQARLLPFEPQNGMQVLVYGHATIYERDGSFQLYADYMRPFGAGAAQMAFDALRKKLEAEGLFAPERKRPLPAVPRCIGVVTSKTGAAWQDVQNVIARRWPGVQLLLAPVNVQGLEAERSIVAGIRALDNDPRPELILVTRGGGSKEDLWIFNSERIARAAAACRKPLVSAVGHEIDTTILDYVADLRAPTPSAAAELCVPDRREMQRKIFILQQNIQNNIQNRCRVCYNKVESLSTGQVMQRTRQAVQRRAQSLAAVSDAVQAQSRRCITTAQAQLQSAAALAASLNPYGVLARGYTVASVGGTVTPVEHLAPGQTVTLRGDKAEADCTVLTVRKPERNATL